MANFKLGTRVIYTDGDGFKKSAEVVGTYDSVSSNGSVKRPDEGRAHLLVKSPTGKQSVRENIAYGEGKRQFTRR